VTFAEMLGALVAPRKPSWRAGLVPISCADCGRSLDLAQPTFVQAHPEPRCVLCQSVAARTDLLKATDALNTVVAQAEVLAIESPAPTNTAFEAAVAEAEEVER
jgi:hypothetical protein